MLHCFCNSYKEQYICNANIPKWVDMACFVTFDLVTFLVRITYVVSFHCFPIRDEFHVICFLYSPTLWWICLVVSYYCCEMMVLLYSLFLLLSFGGTNSMYSFFPPGVEYVLSADVLLTDQFLLPRGRIVLGNRLVSRVSNVTTLTRNESWQMRYLVAFDVSWQKHRNIYRWVSARQT